MPDDEWWLRWLPLGLLALATAVVVPTAPALGDAAADVRLTIGVAAGTALWIRLVPSPTALHYVGRSALAFALCWLNPLYAIFAYVGFTDAEASLRRRWVHVGIAAVAVTLAGAQSGGLPPDSPAQAGLFAVLVVVNGGLASAFLRVGRRSEERAAELQRLNEELERLQATVAVQARAAGVQEERQRLARELHDTLAQSLAGIVTQLQAAADDPTRIARVTDLARQALAEARRSVQDLSPAPLDGVTLAAAVERVVAEWGAAHEVRADLVVTGEPAPLHPEVEATTVRIVQESLANVAKHAAATRVGVTLTYDEEQLILDVRDDGTGFDPATAPRPESFGLRGMRQRAERLAGVLEVESEPDQGATVTARLPAVRRGAA